MSASRVWKRLPALQCIEAVEAIPARPKATTLQGPDATERAEAAEPSIDQEVLAVTRRPIATETKAKQLLIHATPLEIAELLKTEARAGSQSPLFVACSVALMQELRLNCRRLKFQRPLCVSSRNRRLPCPECAIMIKDAVPAYYKLPAQVNDAQMAQYTLEVLEASVVNCGGALIDSNAASATATAELTILVISFLDQKRERVAAGCSTYDQRPRCAGYAAALAMAEH